MKLHRYLVIILAIFLIIWWCLWIRTAAIIPHTSYKITHYTDSIGCSYIIFHNSQVINALHNPKCQNHN